MSWCRTELEDRECPWCHKIFHPGYRKQIYCCRECQLAAVNYNAGWASWWCMKHHPDCIYLKRDDYFGQFCSWDIDNEDTPGRSFDPETQTCDKYEKGEISVWKKQRL